MKKSTQSEFFNPGVTVDVVIFTIEDGQLKILLILRADEPFRNAYALPGGFVHKGETTRDAATRVLRDKGGVDTVYMEQLYTFDEVKRDPRGQILSVTYFTLVPREEIHIHTHSKTENPSFIGIKRLPKLAFDHSDIISYAIKRLADKVRYSNVIYSLLPRYFTLTELQKTYETILDKKIDKRNFRKKFLELDLISPTKKKRVGMRQRPALLYTFKQKGMREMEKFFKTF